MIFLIGGASHTGKTLLAQKLLLKYGYPYLSVDHLKMGLIRSGQTSLTPEDDDKLMEYLWPIVREIIKTAIENRQNLIVEGCYIPFDYKNDFSGEYLAFIKYVCLIFSEGYIQNHYNEIMSNGSKIENRKDDCCSIELMISDNKKSLAECKKYGCEYILIDKNYNFEVDMDKVFESERLIFRRMTKDDFPELCKMLQNPDVMYAWEHAFTDEEVYEWIKKRTALYSRLGYDYFLSVDKNTNEVVGQIGLLDEPVENTHYTGLGYILKKEFWHKGYALEGAHAMLDYAFNVLGKDKVIATIRPENVASVKVAQRLGMKEESRFIKIYNGKEMTHSVYVISKEEFSEKIL